MKNTRHALIENRGPENLRDTLIAELKTASHACIAVAFISQAGLQGILPALRQVAARGSVRILTGLYQALTEPRALNTLLQVQRQTKCGLTACISRESHFHQKMYLINNPNRSTLIVGSSNLTKDGLTSIGELNALLKTQKNDVTISQVTAAFDLAWRGAAPLTPTIIKRYEQRRPIQPRRTLTSRELRQILGNDVSHENAAPPAEPVQYWRDCVWRDLGKRTEEVIISTTNWDKKGYWYFSTGGLHPYTRGDRIIMFDTGRDTVELYRIVDITRTNYATPDGRHFVACTSIRGHKKQLTTRFWTKLATIGTRRNTIRRRRRLNAEQARTLLALLKR